MLLAGRYSEWEYYNSDHAFIAGRNAADRVRQKQSLKPAGLPARELSPQPQSARQ